MDRVYTKEKFINDASDRKFQVLRRLVRGQSPDMIAKGGTGVEDLAILGTGGNARYYRPSEVRTPTNGEGTAKYSYYFRFWENDKSYNEQQIKANGTGLGGFKKFEKILMTQGITDHMNFAETQFWNAPDANLMESSSPSDQKGAVYSIPTLISESANTLPVSNSTSGSSAFTTIGNISPVTYNQWQNQRETYDSANLEDSSNGLFAAFDKMVLDIEFDAVPGYNAYMESDQLAKLAIFTNKDGRTRYQGLIRDRNADLRSGPQDPAYGSPVFNGVPIEYVSQMDASKLNPADNFVTAYPTGKARYFFCNFNYLHFIFQEDDFFTEEEPISGGVQQRDTMTVFWHSSGNLICTSRRRQGIVYPA